MTDERSAVIAGATVVIADEARRATKETTTNANGFFAFPQLQPTVYAIKQCFDSFAGRGFD